MTPNPDFIDTLLFDAEYLRSGTRCRRSYIGILIGTYMRPTQRCKFEWLLVILSDSKIFNDTKHRAASLR